MSFASLALGFGLGVLFAAVLGLVALLVVAGVCWRWARAAERSGIDITIPDPAEGASLSARAS